MLQLVKLNSWPIRGKLILIVLAVLLPATGILVVSNLADRRQIIHAAEENVHLVVQSLVAQQEQVAYGTRMMLTTLAKLPDVQELDIPACSELFRDLLKQHPFYTTIALATPDGNLIADARSFNPGTVNLYEQKHIRDVIKTLDFSAGEYVVGKVSKIPTIHYSHPVLDPDRHLKAILIAGFNLNEYASFITNSGLLQDSSFSIADHRGVRLFRFPESNRVPVGKPFPADALALISGDLDHGSFETVSDDGTPRFYAFRQLRLTSDSSPYLYVVAGIAKEKILHTANLKLVQDLAILFLFALLVLGVAWTLASLSIVRPMNQLIRANQLFGSGEPRVRSGLAHTRDELGQMAQSFDHMVSLLEIRDNERKQAEEMLRRSEAQFRMLVENSHDIIYSITAEGILTFVSPAWTILLGHTVADVVGKSFDVFVHPDDTQACLEFIRTVTESGERKEGIEFRVRHNDGSWHWHTSSAVPWRDDEGTIKGFHGIGRDITERKHAEMALRESESKYRQLFEVESDALILVDAETLDILDVNPSTEILYGYNRDELLAMRSLDVSEEREKTSHAISQEVEHVSTRWHRKKDGTVFPVEIAGTYFVLEERRVHLAAIRDVSERVSAEQTLRESEERWQFALEGAGDGVWDWNAKANEVIYSRQWKAMLGYDEEDIGNSLQEWDQRVHPEDRSRVYEEIQMHLTGKAEVYISEHRMKCKDGTYKWILDRGKVIRWTEDGQPLRVIGIHTDIHERKMAEEERLRLEQRLQRAQKMESLGRMAAAIAHNFNNMLGAVIGNLELALDDISRGSNLEICISEAMKASSRAAEISRFMLTYLGQTTGRPRRIDPPQVVTEALSLLGSSLQGNIHLKNDISACGVIIEADEAHLTQILTSILSNAAEAIGEERGEITLNMDVVPRYSIESTNLFPPGWEARADEYVCISVNDTGRGIEPENLDKIFDPFFSTKFAGRGLGLAAASGLLQSMWGAISVDSRPGVSGTTFKLYLPVSELMPLEHPQDEALIGSLVKECGLVLVVDDEAMVLSMAAAMLKRKLGCEVLTASDGYEALKIFNERKDEIDLVVLDLSMPGMNGWQVLDGLRAFRADIPVILASDYDETQVMRGGGMEKPQAFLGKPYGAKDLKEAVAEAQKARPGTYS